MFDLKSIQTFLQGVNRFYATFERRDIRKRIIWQEGSTQVIDYALEPNKDLPVIFLIPSLINKSYILDLTCDLSFVGYFVSKGYRVYLVSFGEPIESEYDMGFISYKSRLEKALNDVRGRDKVITIGYCLGGLFACALSNKNIQSQVLIATPWRFKHFSSVLGLDNHEIMEQLISIIRMLDKVSPSLVQWFFYALDPYKIWHKFSNFSDMEKYKDIEKFIAIEQWVNDGISLSKKFVLEALELLRKDNLEEKKFFQVNKNLPTLIVAGTDDKIVPSSSYKELAELFINKEILVKDTGHIGLIISRMAKEEIWPKIDKFLKNS